MFFAALLSAYTCTAQTNYATRQEAEEALKEGYKTPSGWVIKKGDKLLLGPGSTGDKKFAFVYEAPGLTLNTSRTPLPASYSNKNVTVKYVLASGTKKTGFIPVVVVGVGLLTNYNVDIDNAIEAGEVVVPKEFKKGATAGAAAPAPASSLADELKKLKDLLDSGAITKQEYETMKKKLISQ